MNGKRCGWVVGGMVLGVLALAGGASHAQQTPYTRRDFARFRLYRHWQLDERRSTVSPTGDGLKAHYMWANKRNKPRWVLVQINRERGADAHLKRPDLYGRSPDEIRHTKSSYSARRTSRRPAYHVHISILGDETTDRAIRALLDRLEKVANELIDEKEGAPPKRTLTPKRRLYLYHYHPFSRKIPRHRRPCDVVAALKDGRGKPVPNKRIYFYTGRDDSCKDILMLLPPDFRSLHWCPNCVNPDNWICVATDQEGKAVFNYHRYLGPGKYLFPKLDLGNLIAELRRSRGVVFSLHAVLLEDRKPTPDKPRKPLASAQIVIPFGGVAQIRAIGATDKGQESDVWLRRRGKTVRITRRDGDFDYGLDYRETHIEFPICHYDLLPDDVVLIGKNDTVDVKWLSGVRIHVKPKPGVLEAMEAQRNDGKPAYGELWIGGKDAGWRRWLDAKLNNYAASGALLTGAPFVVGLGFAKYAAAETAVAASSVLAVPGVLALGYVIGRDWVWGEPLSIEAYSTLLIDLDKTTTVFTVEGKAKLSIGQGRGATVRTGQKVEVSPKGEFGPVTKFERRELTKAQAAVLAHMEQVARDKTGKSDVKARPSVRSDTKHTGKKGRKGPRKKAKVKARRKVRAIIETNLGSLEAELWPDVAPRTVANFVRLAKSGFYRDLPCRRMLPGFAVQFGEPTDLAGARTLRPIKGEFSRTLRHTRGTISMARKPNDPDSATSQFLICFRPRNDKQRRALAALDGKYAIFGRVTRPLAVLDRIEAVPTAPRVVARGVTERSKPIKRIMLKAVRIVEQQ